MTENIDPAKKLCPDCGAERVWAEPAGYGVSVKPKDALIKNAYMLKALVCTGCGLTLWYHPEPLKAVKKRGENPFKPG